MRIDRILTTHAGSLPRPPALTALHARRYRRENVEGAELRRLGEEATAAVVARQLEVGLDVVNNGEVAREGFFTYVQHRMSGMGGESARRPMADLLAYPDWLREIRRRAPAEQVSLIGTPRIVGEVTYRDRGAIDQECALLRRLLDAAPRQPADAFVTAPSPGIVAAAMANDHYPDTGACVRAVARALATEYCAIVEHGFLLQIDAPDLAMERHTLFAERPLSDFLDFVREVVGALRESLAGLPRERIRLHVCWGNYEGPHDQDVALADLLPELGGVPAGTLLLSLANPRHAHEWRLLEPGALPPATVVVPGVIDTTTNYVEHPETVAERIERVAERLGDPRRVQAGTDCGFETSAGYTLVAPEIAWQKLRALVAGAALASARLFARSGS